MESCVACSGACPPLTGVSVLFVFEGMCWHEMLHAVICGDGMNSCS